MLTNQCPDCGDDGLVVECSGWRELAWLAGSRLDPLILMDGIRAGQRPEVLEWCYVVCLRCSAQGVRTTVDTAQP